MKKSFFPLVAIALTATLLFGCNGNNTSGDLSDNSQNNPTVNNTGLSGEELAKLLLADERLDTSVLKGGNDLFEAKTAANY